LKFSQRTYDRNLNRISSTDGATAATSHSIRARMSQTLLEPDPITSNDIISSASLFQLRPHRTWFACVFDWSPRHIPCMLHNF